MDCLNVDWDKVNLDTFDWAAYDKCMGYNWILRQFARNHWDSLLRTSTRKPLYLKFPPQKLLSATAEYALQQKRANLF